MEKIFWNDRLSAIFKYFSNGKDSCTNHPIIMRQTSNLPQNNNLISEYELMQSIQDARLEHKKGQSIKCNSMSDLLIKIKCPKRSQPPTSQLVQQ